MGHPTLDTGPARVIDDDDAERSPDAEKRRHRRVEVGVRCWITNERHTVYLRLHDLSLGGLSVRAPVPFRPTGRVD
ncbi:MAG TPA: PilZ domain-containing protein, partial [Polyangia bacterium]|nr:PilZ domain-containing protein [Polyangia bacterium]